MENTVKVNTTEYLEVIILNLDENEEEISMEDPKFSEKLKKIEVAILPAIKTETFMTHIEESDETGLETEKTKKISEEITRYLDKVPECYSGKNGGLFLTKNDAFSAIKQAFSGHFWGEKMAYLGQSRCSAFFCLRGITIQGRGLDGLLGGFVKFLFSKFENIKICGNEKLEVCFEDVNIEKVKSLTLDNCKIVLTGVNLIGTEELIIRNCHVISRFMKDESETISQMSVKILKKLSIFSMKFLNDCRMVFTGEKVTEKQYSSCEVDIINVFIDFEDSQYSKESDILLKIQNFYKVMIDNIVFDNNAKLNKLTPLGFDTITNLVLSDYKYNNTEINKKSPHIRINTVSKVDISDCYIISNKKSENMFINFNKMDSLSEIYMFDSEFTDITIARFIGNKISALKISDIIFKSDLDEPFLFKGSNVFDECFIKNCNFETKSSLNFLKKNFISQHLDFKNTNIRTKGDINIENCYTFIEDSGIKCNNISITTTQNDVDENKIRFSSENTMYEVKNDMILIDDCTFGRISYNLVNIKCKSYKDENYSKVSWANSNILAANYNFDSKYYRIKENAVIETKKIKSNKSLNFGGYLDGKLVLNYKDTNVYSCEVVFNPEKYDDTEYHNLDLIFDGNDSQIQLFDIKIHNTAQNIVCSNKNNNINTKINLYILGLLPIDKGCTFFIKKDNQILLKLEEVIDSLLSRCKYTLKGKLEKKCLNYGQK